jgi:hypothetical protein
MGDKLLLPEASASVFQPRLAAWIGLNESILLQHVHYLAGKVDFGAVVDGVKWIRMTTEEWAEELPCFDAHTIRRTLDNLEKDTLITSRTFSGRSKWYRVNYELLTTVDGPVERLQSRTKARVKANEKAKEAKHNASVQNGHIDNPSVQNGQLYLSKMDNPSVQNGQLPRPLPRPLSKTYSPNGESGKKPPAKNKDSPPVSVLAYRSVANRYPDKATWLAIAEAVGDNETDLQFWKEVVTTWIARGYKKINIDGMLDWFKKREIPKGKDGRNKQAKSKNQQQGTKLDPANPDHWRKMLEST